MQSLKSRRSAVPECLRRGCLRRAVQARGCGRSSRCRIVLLRGRNRRSAASALLYPHCSFSAVFSVGRERISLSVAWCEVWETLAWLRGSIRHSYAAAGPHRNITVDPRIHQGSLVEFDDGQDRWAGCTAQRIGGLVDDSARDDHTCAGRLDRFETLGVASGTAGRRRCQHRGAVSTFPDDELSEPGGPVVGVSWGPRGRRKMAVCTS